jgi:hypothetical protein
MKKTFLGFITTCMLLLATTPTQLKAAPLPVTTPINPVTAVDDSGGEAVLTQAEADLLVARLEEINAMDKSGLTRTEKRELRREVRTIENRLNASSTAGGGPVIYISGGALLLIILLIILL